MLGTVKIGRLFGLTTYFAKKEYRRSTMAITGTMLVAAKLQYASLCKCDAEEKSEQEQYQDRSRITTNCHQYYSRDCFLPTSTPIMLATCSSTNAPLVDAINIEQPAQSTRRLWWWRLKLKHKTWWKRIGQTFFVIARGIEIVARLSPLLILTPTAMVVSYIDPIWKRCTNFGVPKKEKNDLEPLLTIEGLEKSDDDIYTMQFQDSAYHHTSTWASLAWSYTLHTLQCLGPAFVKLGQWAATRRDLFPVNMCNHLSELHDAARIHDWKYTHDALVEAFGEDYDARGLLVVQNEGRCSNNGQDSGILGSGSAAQVHRGTLTTTTNKGSKSSNNAAHKRTVAIKVLHPNTRQLVERDLALMQYIADFIDKIPLQFVKMLSLPRAVSNFANVMERQVDLRIEGNNLQIFRENFGCSGYYEDIKSYPPGITFPCPELAWISERVLVEEHAGDDAVPISRYMSDDSPEGLETRKRLAGPLLRAFLKMVFIDNFIHADLHPGNVLVRAVPSKTNPKRENYTIIFLDAGIATSLQPTDRKNLHDLFKAVVLNDGYTAGSLMVERARYERCTSIPGGKHAFATGVSDIVSEFHDRRKRGLTLGAVRVGALLGQVLDLCRTYGVEIDPAMSSVVVSMLVLEGLGRSLDPDLNLIKAAVPFLLGRGKG